MIKRNSVIAGAFFKDIEFEKLIGDILIEVIQENIDLDTHENDEDRGHNIEEPDIQ